MPAAQPEIALVHALSTPLVAAPFPDLSGVNTIDQFAALAIGRADLSRAASRLAIEEALRAEVKEFAKYELMEAETIVAVLEDLGTPLPQMGGEAWAALAQIINTPAGSAFDAAYMTVEYENHAFLRDLADAYLRNSDANTGGSRERYGRHIASMALVAFTEHTGITQRILRRLAA